MWDQCLDPHLHIWKPGAPKFQLQAFPYSWCPPYLNSVAVSASSTSWLSRKNGDIPVLVLAGPGPGKRRDNKGARINGTCCMPQHMLRQGAKSPPCLNHFFTQLDHVTPHCISSVCKHGGKHSCWTEQCSCGILLCSGLAARGVAGSFSITPFTGEHCCLAAPLFPMYSTYTEL